MLETLPRCGPQIARRLSSSCAPRRNLIMITGARRGAAAGVENAAPPAEKLAKTMATKSTDAPPSANNEFPPLRVKKLVPEALLPVRGSAGAAGYDLAR